ncbi:MAG: tetratricopeptide repeat protein [Gemmatimonadota bacterium]
MARSIAREASKRPELNTEDELMEKAGRLAAWASNNRPVVIMVAIAVVALIAAGIQYRNYQVSATEKGAVHLAQLRLTAGAADPSRQIEGLQTFVAQFGATPVGNQGRIMLAELELQRDSTAAAIAVLQEVVAGADDSPTYYSALQMLAGAHEQAGDVESALRRYAELAEEARFEYLRRIAGMAQGRLLASDGRLEEAAAVYERLIGDSGEDVTASAYATIRLAELQARMQGTSGEQAE